MTTDPGTTMMQAKLFCAFSRNVCIVLFLESCSIRVGPLIEFKALSLASEVFSQTEPHKDKYMSAMVAESRPHMRFFF